jgi:putative flippase GtrA
MKSKVIKYIITGLTSFTVDYGGLLFLYRIVGLPVGIATTLAFIVGLTVNFLLNRYWVFNISKRGKVTMAYQTVAYGLLVLMNLVITDVIVIYLSRKHIGPEVSKIISTAIITIWNYVVYKKAIFKEPRSQE